MLRDTHSSLAMNEIKQEHGGLDPAALAARGISAADLLDFSVNINPFGACEGVYAALRNFRPEEYPDRRAAALHERLAAGNGVSPAQVLAGNGTAELIWLAAFAWMRGEKVAVFGPSFGEYARAARAVGAELSFFNAAAPDFRWEVTRAAAEIHRIHPAITFLCNPNNPTGVFLAADEVRLLAEACGEGLLILDEAYRSFITLHVFGLSLEPLPSNVLVLRSMTKDFALAGLRLGYALGSEERISGLRAIQPPWSLNAAAQMAGLAALDDPAHLQSTLAQTREAAQALRAELAQAGARVLPSETPFCLVDVSPLSGQAVFGALLGEGIQVRDCASFGLAEYVRIGTRRPGENERLLQAWRKLFYRLPH